MVLGKASTITLAAAVLLAACVEVTTTSYIRQSNSIVEQAYVQPGADFSKYTKLMTDGLEIYYPQSDAKPPEAALEGIRAS